MTRTIRAITVAVVLLPGTTDAQDYRDSSQLEMQFTTVRGVVTDDLGRPMEGVRVGIREADVDPNTVPSSADFGSWGVDAMPAETFSDPSRDREIFAWDTTNAKGRFAITGVPRPGAFIVIIANVEGYRRVDAPISIAASVGRIFDVDLVMRALVGAAPTATVSVQGLVALAGAAEQNGDLKAAIAKLEEVVALAPEAAAPRFHLARLAAAVGDARRAWSEITATCELAPACGECWLLRAEIARGLGNASDALAAASKAVELLPESGAAHAVLGLQLYEAERHGEALPALDRAAALGSADSNVFLYRANCLVVGRRFVEAIAAYENFLQSFPEAPNRGQVENVLAALRAMVGGG